MAVKRQEKTGAAKKQAPAKRARLDNNPMREVGELLRQFLSLPVEKREAFLATFPQAPTRTRREQADELVDQAQDAPTAAKALTLIRRALVLDPENVDALVHLAGLTSKTPEQAAVRLAVAVTAGENALGPEYFEANKGHFWGLIETRPYMRARHRLADMLLHLGRVGEAIGHFEAMLELNPSDNQGIRELLLAAYLTAADLEGARRVLTVYKEDCGAVFAWGRVLEHILSEQFQAAEAALVKARKSNPYVELYLTAQRVLLRDTPDSYTLGSEEEAYFCFETLGGAWLAHMHAVMWLVSKGELGAATRARRTRVVKVPKPSVS